MTETVDARFDPESGDDDEELVEWEDMYDPPVDDFHDPIDHEDDRFQDVELVRSCSNILETPVMLPQRQIQHLCKNLPQNSTSINKAPASFSRTSAQVNCKAPAPFNKTPAALNKTPVSFNKTPAPFNKTPASFNKTPTPINNQKKTRPTEGGKCPRQLFPLEEPESGCSQCKKLKLENAQLREKLDKAQEPPRPGKVHQLVADRFQMLQLSPGWLVYIYPSNNDKARRRKSATACTCYLLNVFYTNQELMAINLTGANDKECIDPDILSSLIAFTTKNFPSTTEAEVKRVLRNKISGIVSREKKTPMLKPNL